MSIMAIYHTAARQGYEKFFESREKPFSSDNGQYIVSVASALLMARDGLHSPSGFVKAVIENDLTRAVQRADVECSQHLHYFVYCKEFVHPKEQSL